MNSFSTNAPTSAAALTPTPEPRRYTTDDFDFVLPNELIAQQPAASRTASRLLDASGSVFADRNFGELPHLLRAGDVLVFNDTKVVKARLFARKATGGAVEMLVERVLKHGDIASASGFAHEVVVHLKVSKKPRVGEAVEILGCADDSQANSHAKSQVIAQATLLGRWPDANGALFRFGLTVEPYALMQAAGYMPLPPYVARDQAQAPAAETAHDAERYQTVFAREPGAVAAPTAALHFDDALLATLRSMGVATEFVTLHVGAGTFAPVKVDDIAQHTMHAERYSVPRSTLAAVQAARAAGGRVIAVGTTSVRALESALRPEFVTFEDAHRVQGDTQIFITPGFEFKAVDALITNFHLPKSTLMMLVSAFAGYDRIRAVYDHAIRQHYRFFSYGDAMLLSKAAA